MKYILHDVIVMWSVSLHQSSPVASWENN